MLKNKQTFNLPTARLSYNPVKDISKIEEQYVYKDTERNAKIVIEIGFDFDLSSIPRLFWKIIGPYELSVEAPLIHDFMYLSRGGRRSDWPHGTPILGKIEPNTCLYSRRDADELFLTMMRQAGVRSWRRFLRYRAVRIFGWLFWKPDEEGGQSNQPGGTD
ncbi:MAG: DUF1353 domain-containing protein [Cyanothece sp. SIO1E1]|nr:DUF1353 domain-containing protein [Cyanothece sp. SIO1E1]